MRHLLFATVGIAALSLATGALAQAEPPIAPTAADGEQGVIAYPPSFFVDAQPNTAMEMVSRLPGFAFDGGSGVRGFAGAAGNVLVDGERPTTKSDDLQSILRRIPASQVERIDVIRGGAPGIDMQGKTVMANIIVKKGAAVTGVIAIVNDFIYDGRNSPGIRLEGVRRADGRTLEGSLIAAAFHDDGAGDGPLVQRDAAGTIIEQGDMRAEGDGQQIVGTAAYSTPLAGGKFRINGRMFFQRFYYGQHDDFDVAGFTAKDRELEERREGEIGLRYGRDLGPRTKLESLFIQQWKEQDFNLRFQAGGDEELFSNERKLGETIGRASVNFRQSDTLSIEFGGEGAFNWLETATTYSFNGTPVALPAAKVRVEERRGEAFGTATWNATPRLTLEGGLRYEYSTITSEGDVELEKSLQFAKPRLVATWSPNEQNQVRVRVEREVGQLNFGDFIAGSAIATGGGVSTGNVDINPQQGLVTEIAYERRFWGNGAITLTLRHTELTDAIDRAPDVVLSSCPLVAGVPDPTSPLCTRYDRPANIGDGSRDQAQIDFNLPLDRLGVKGGMVRGFYVLRESEVIDPTTFDPRRITAEHPYDWEVHFTQDLPQWKLTWGVDVFGEFTETYWRYNRVEQTELKSFVIPYVEWKPRKDLQFLLQLKNFTERPLIKEQAFYSGDRATGVLQLRETRTYENGMSVYVRVRKTFG